MRLQLRIPPDPHYARTVRDAVMGFALLHGIAQSDLEALLFAIGEALANAIEHARSARDLEVVATIDDDHILASIIDFGRGLPALPADDAPLPSALSERGRGIPIMQRCTDFFSVESRPGAGTVVTLGRFRRDRLSIATPSSQETSAAS